MSALGFNIRTDGDRAVVEVAGEVDMATAPELLDAVVAMHNASGQDVTVDLRGVTFMDSRGVATLVMAHRHLAANHCRLRIAHARPGVAKVLDVTGVSAYLTLCEEPPSA